MTFASSALKRAEERVERFTIDKEEVDVGAL